MISKKQLDRSKDGQVYNCPTCGSEVEENFCGVCGEKRLNRHDFSFRHFAEETFEGFTHFDNKFFRTAYQLIFKPGQVSVDFCHGKKVPYMKPFPMFIICNILFFLLVGDINMFSQPLYSFIHYTPYTYFNTRETVQTMISSEAEYKTLAIAFNQKMGAESKAFLAIFIPILALGSMTVNYRRRTYFSEHLIFGIHYFTVVIMFYTVWLSIIINPYYTWIKPNQSDSNFDFISSFIAITILGYYFGTSARNFYNVSRARSIVGSVVLAFVFMISVMSYRLLLFYKIIYSLHWHSGS